MDDGLEMRLERLLPQDAGQLAVQGSIGTGNDGERFWMEGENGE